MGMGPRPVKTAGMAEAIFAAGEERFPSIGRPKMQSWSVHEMAVAPRIPPEAGEGIIRAFEHIWSSPNGRGELFMSGAKTTKWSLAEPGDPGAVSWSDANRLLNEYRNEARDLREKLEELKNNYPLLGIKFEPWKDNEPSNTVQLANALNTIQDIKSGYFFEVQRIEKAIEQDKEFQRIFAELEKLKRSDPTAKNKWQELLEKITAIELETGTDYPDLEGSLKEIKNLLEVATNYGPEQVDALRKSYGDLNEKVSVYNNNIRARDAIRSNSARYATELLHALRDGTGKNAELLARLEEVQRREKDLTTELIEEAERTIIKMEQDRKAVERRRAAEMICKAFEARGYIVPRQDFETAFAKGGEILMRKQQPGWNDYFCRLKVDAQSENLEYRLIRETNDPSKRTQDDVLKDQLMDESLCSEFRGDIMQSLKEKGLELTDPVAQADNLVLLVKRSGSRGGHGGHEGHGGDGEPPIAVPLPLPQQ